MADSRFTNHQIKTTLMGAPQTGKTACATQYLENNFFDNYIPTSAVTFASKDISIEKEKVKILIWDAAGDDRYKSILPIYCHAAHCVFVFFDVTQVTTFAAVDDYVRIARKTSMAPEGQIFLVGNKLDLADQRQVSEEEARNKAIELGVEYTEISAKNKDDVHKLFQASVEKIMKKLPQLMQNSQSKLQEIEPSVMPAKQEQLPFYKKHTKKILAVAFALAAIGVILAAWFWPLIVAAVPATMVTGILSSLGVAITAKSIVVTASILAGTAVTLLGSALSVAGSFLFAKISELMDQRFFPDENRQMGGAQKNYQIGQMPNIHKYLPLDQPRTNPIPVQTQPAETNSPSLSRSTAYSLQSEHLKHSSDESFTPRFG